MHINIFKFKGQFGNKQVDCNCSTDLFFDSVVQTQKMIVFIYGPKSLGDTWRSLVNASIYTVMVVNIAELGWKSCTE